MSSKIVSIVKLLKIFYANLCVALIYLHIFFFGFKIWHFVRTIILNLSLEKPQIFGGIFV